MTYYTATCYTSASVLWDLTFTSMNCIDENPEIFKPHKLFCTRIVVEKKTTSQLGDSYPPSTVTVATIQVENQEEAKRILKIYPVAV